MNINYISQITDNQPIESSDRSPYTVLLVSSSCPKLSQAALNSFSKAEKHVPTNQPSHPIAIPVVFSKSYPHQSQSYPKAIFTFLRFVHFLSFLSKSRPIPGYPRLISTILKFLSQNLTSSIPTLPTPIPHPSRDLLTSFPESSWDWLG